MNGETLAALLVTAPLLVLFVYDLDVARMVRRAERIRPQIPFLSGVKVLVYAVCVGAAIGVLLGFNSAFLNITGIRLVPPPLPFILIYIAIVSGSAGLLMLRRRIKRLVPEVDE